jgi:ubiquinone/menaquinone biosynthesis C-methylase UbiE
VNFLNPEDALKQFGIYGAQDVADIGSGAGHFALAAAKRLNGGRLFAIDIQKDMLSRLSSVAHDLGITNIHTLWGDAAHYKGIPLADASLDRVIVVNILHSAEDRDVFAKEIRRLLKPEGKILLVDWHQKGTMGPHERHRIDETTALGFFERHGFEKEKDIDAGGYHYGMILKVVR